LDPPVPHAVVTSGAAEKPTRVRPGAPHVKCVADVLVRASCSRGTIDIVEDEKQPFSRTREEIGGCHRHLDRFY
jgi:hypothetical protein